MPPRAAADPRWEFERFQLIPGQRLLLNDGTPVPLTSKAFAILVLLVENRDRIVTKDELLRGAWPDTIVEEGNLTQQIFILRRALGESAQQQHCIVTVPGHGYRFTAPVREVSSAGPDAPEGEERLVVPSTGGRARAGRLMTAGIIAAGILGLIGVVLLTKGARPPEPTSRGPATLRLTKVTETGIVTSATLSPDGRYVAYAESDGAEYSLVVQQIATGGTTQVVPREPNVLRSLSFSPDGHYLYFTRGKPLGSGFLLHRVPAIGGPQTPIRDDVDSAVSFSPDGRRFAFMRGAGPETQIVVADVDGGSQRILAKRTEPLAFWFTMPAWSPDGSYIAASAGDLTRGSHTSIVLLPVDGDASRELYRSEHRIGAIRWLPDGSGLLAVVSETLTRQFAPWFSLGLPFLGGSIWRIGYPDGSAERLTTDLDDYDLCCVGVAESGSVITGVLNSMVSDVWVAPADQLQTPRQVSWGSRMLGRHTWLPDNDTIVYRDVTGRLNAVRTNGRELRLAVPDGLKVTGGVAVCGQGRYVVFAAVPGHNIWRITLEGGGAVQLTAGSADHDPVCSGDGKWILFASKRGDEVSTWRLPVEGGEAAPLVEKSFWALPSPKGSMIVYFTYEWDMHPEPLRRSRWVVLSAADRSRLFTLYAPADAGPGVPINWAPDESGLDYVVTRRGVSNIWRLPLGGGPPRQITHFTAGRILSFAWSPNGQWLSLGSGVSRSDVVLMSREP